MTSSPSFFWWRPHHPYSRSIIGRDAVKRRGTSSSKRTKANYVSLLLLFHHGRYWCVFRSVFLFGLITNCSQVRFSFSVYISFCCCFFSSGNTYNETCFIVLHFPCRQKSSVNLILILVVRLTCYDVMHPILECVFLWREDEGQEDFLVIARLKFCHVLLTS